MSACATTLIVFATILGPITLVFLSISFGTDHWLEFHVNRNELTKVFRSRTIRDTNLARYTHSRDRGIFRECYPGNDTEFLFRSKEVVDEYCFNIQYESDDDQNHSDDYMARIHLNRCFLAFYIIAIVLFVLAYVFGLILCCLRVSRWAYIAGLCSYSAAFSIAAAIAFFHGAEYIERNRAQAELYTEWDKVKDATSRRYGWSYALSWVGMVLAALTATFYSVAGCYITSEMYEDREILEKHRGGRDYPIAMEPVYAVGSDPYYNKQYGYRQGYLGPMTPEYYARGSHPSIGYSEPGKDMWQWREIEG